MTDFDARHEAFRRGVSWAVSEMKDPLDLGAHGSAKWVDGPPLLRCAQCGSPFVNGYVRTTELKPVDLMGSATPREHAEPRSFDVCSEACAERLWAEHK